MGQCSEIIPHGGFHVPLRVLRLPSKSHWLVRALGGRHGILNLKFHMHANLLSHAAQRANNPKDLLGITTCQRNKDADTEGSRGRSRTNNYIALQLALAEDWT
jgi:hypothetical protein